MDFQPFLNRMRKELESRGFSSAYVQRLLHEWHDHLIDLSEEKGNAMSMDASLSGGLVNRMGEPRELADAAAKEFRKRTFAGRHPVVTFLLAPIPLTIVAWIGMFLLGIGGVELAKWMMGGELTPSSGEWTPTAIFGAYAMLYAFVLTPPISLATYFVRLSRNSLRGWKWGLASCLLIALMAAAFQSNLGFPSGAAKGHLSLGFGIGPHTFTSPMAMVQFGLPLAFGLLALWRGRRAMLAS